MLRNLSFALACAASLALALPAAVSAEPAAGEAPAKAKRPYAAKRPVSRLPKDPGFLPGYEPPPVDRFGSPVFGDNAAYGYGRGGRYWYRGRWLYGFGGPGYYRGRWNGGGFGPCYTSTPIGPVWNCGR